MWYEDCTEADTEDTEDTNVIVLGVVAPSLGPPLRVVGVVGQALASASYNGRLAPLLAASKLPDDDGLVLASSK